MSRMSSLSTCSSESRSRETTSATAVFACIHFRLQAPASYDDAVARLAHAGRIADTLADPLEKAANFRDALVHAFDDIDAASIYRAARVLPGDLRSFMTEMAGQVD